MRTVIRPLVPRMEYGLRLISKRIPYSFFFMTIFMFIWLAPVEAQRASVSCYGRVNVSINSGTPTRLSLEHLTPMNDLSDVIFEADDRDELSFVCGDVGSIIMVSIIDTMIDQRCMVEIHVEDKSNLQISCQDTSFTCLQGLDILTGDDVIHVTSSCDDLTGTVISFHPIDTIPYGPDSDTLESIIGRWDVRESNGNVLSCESTIYLTRFDLLDIQFPSNVTIFCDQDANDTTLTGGINYNVIDLAERCQVGVTSTIIDTIKVPCVDSFKIIKQWVALDWANMTSRDTFQYIYVKDTIPVLIDAPDSFVILQDSCDFKLVIGAPTIDASPWANVTLEDLSVSIRYDIYEIGDTVSLPPGDYEVIYRGGSPVCNNLITPDTAHVSISDQMAPVIICDTIPELAIALVNGMETWIDLDSLFKDLPVMSCNPYSFEGRKLIPTCGSDSGIFRTKLALCIEELLSCQVPGTIQLEIRAKANNDSISNVCLVTIDVQEKIPPVIIPKADAEVHLDGDNMLFTLDTAVVISSLTDNSGVIASLTMTGSGIGATTGSGLPFLAGGEFITFDCSLAGSYDVAIFATDCDNNIDTVITQLTVDPDGLCAMPRSLAGQISNNNRPIQDIAVAFTSNDERTISITDHQGRFTFEPVSMSDPVMITIRHDDDWQAGITVRDLQLLERYILGLDPLEPWQLASADVDDSGEINTKDLLTIHRLLRGIPTDLHEDAMPWIFSDGQEDQAYSDYFSHYVRANESDEMSITGVKRGDIDGDVILDAQARSLFKLPVHIRRVDETKVEFSFEIQRIPDIAAFQLSLQIENGSLLGQARDYEGIWGTPNNLDIIHYNHELKERNNINFIVEHKIGERPSINLDDGMEPIYFDHTGRRYGLQLESIESNILNDELINYVAVPNPTANHSHIILQGPDVYTRFLTINLYDIQGKRILSRNWTDVQLTDVFPFNVPELPVNGMFFLQIRTDHRIENLHIIKN